MPHLAQNRASRSRLNKRMSPSKNGYSIRILRVDVPSILVYLKKSASEWQDLVSSEKGTIMESPVTGYNASRKPNLDRQQAPE